MSILRCTFINTYLKERIINFTSTIVLLAYQINIGSMKSKSRYN